MSNYLFSVQNCPAPDYVHNIRNNIDIKFPSNGFNPYITVADDVSSLGFLTLLTYQTSAKTKFNSKSDVRNTYLVSCILYSFSIGFVLRAINFLDTFGEIF